MKKVTSTVLTALFLCAAPLGASLSAQESQSAPGAAPTPASQGEVSNTKRPVPERLTQRLQEAQARLGKLQGRVEEALTAPDVETLKANRKAHKNNRKAEQGQRREQIKQRVKQWAQDNPEKAERIRRARANGQKGQKGQQLGQALKSRRGPADGQRATGGRQMDRRGAPGQRRAVGQRDGSGQGRALGQSRAPGQRRGFGQRGAWEQGPANGQGFRAGARGQRFGQALRNQHQNSRGTARQRGQERRSDRGQIGRRSQRRR